MYEEIIPNLYLIKTKKPSCNSYLIAGNQKKILIDSGVNEHFRYLKKNIKKIGFDIHDLNMVIIPMNMWTILEPIATCKKKRLS